MGCRCSRPKEAVVRENHRPQRDFRERYRLGPVLGSGSFGLVRVCFNRWNDEIYACKIMSKKPKPVNRGSQTVDLVAMFRNEYDIIRNLRHPNVVHLIEVFEDRHNLYAVMEKCDGGELFTRIVQKRQFSEFEAIKLCRDMLSAIEYCHSMNVVHRDIKAENFLFTHISEHDGDSRLVLIDFGMSVQLIGEQPNSLKQMCGSPHYVAPELIRRSYQKEVDLWALGVVIYLMLFGKYPFEGSDQKQIANRILKSEPDMVRNVSRPLSSECIDFLKGLLQKDPCKRLSATDALKHSWISNGPQHKQRRLIRALGNKFYENCSSLHSEEASLVDVDLMHFTATKLDSPRPKSLIAIHENSRNDKSGTGHNRQVDHG